jgi:hypothetical protein
MKKLMIAAGCLLLPLAAQAQSSRDDLDYCVRLADTYITYIGTDESSGSSMRGSTDVEGAVAVAQCRKGNTSAIPVLERKLRANGFTVPRRS